MPTASLLALADERFVSLTTVRRSGARVSTPVWIARDGDALLVTTPADSGKVKRLRNDPTVVLRPCSRRGSVAPDAPSATGTAEIIADEPRVASYGRVFAADYGLEYRVFMFIERLARRSNPRRVILRITAV